MIDRLLATAMASNLESCARIHRNMATKAASEADKAIFIRGATTYDRIAAELREEAKQ